MFAMIAGEVQSKDSCKLLNWSHRHALVFHSSLLGIQSLTENVERPFWGSTESDFVIRSLRRTEWFLQRGYIYMYIFVEAEHLIKWIRCVHIEEIWNYHTLLHADGKNASQIVFYWWNIYPMFQFMWWKPLLRFKVHDKKNKKLGADHSWPSGQKTWAFFIASPSTPSCINNRLSVSVDQLPDGNNKSTSTQGSGPEGSQGECLKKNG